MPVPQTQIIGEIEQALRVGSADKRIKMLMNVTDLFVAGAPTYSETDTKLFGDVFGRLTAQVESTALAELSARLAPLTNAPVDTIRSLARHDDAQVAGPVLKQSTRLSDSDLIEVAQTKSQEHLLNIAGRAQINAPVTDALVDNGDADVANEVAINAGARISDLTMAKLVMRADGDDRLTGSMAQRSDISPAMFRQLLLQATEAVRGKLLAAAKPGQQAAIKQVLDEISAQATAAAPPRNFSQAQRVVSSFRQDTDLTRTKIQEFADSGRIAEMIVSISVLSGVSTEQLDQVFQSVNAFGLMVLCKSVDLTWDAARAVITARPQPAGALNGLRTQYGQLSVQSAQKLVHFWLGRQKIAQNFRAGPK